MPWSPKSSWTPSPNSSLPRGAQPRYSSGGSPAWQPAPSTPTPPRYNRNLTGRGRSASLRQANIRANASRLRRFNRPSGGINPQTIVQAQTQAQAQASAIAQAQALLAASPSAAFSSAPLATTALLASGFAVGLAIGDAIYGAFSDDPSLSDYARRWLGRLGDTSIPQPSGAEGFGPIFYEGGQEPGVLYNVSYSYRNISAPGQENNPFENANRNLYGPIILINEQTLYHNQNVYGTQFPYYVWYFISDFNGAFQRIDATELTNIVITRLDGEPDTGGNIGNFYPGNPTISPYIDEAYQDTPPSPTAPTSPTSPPSPTAPTSPTSLPSPLPVTAPIGSTPKAPTGNTTPPVKTKDPPTPTQNNGSPPTASGSGNNCICSPTVNTIEKVIKERVESKLQFTSITVPVVSCLLVSDQWQSVRQNTVVQVLAGLESQISQNFEELAKVLEAQCDQKNQECPEPLLAVSDVFGLSPGQNRPVILIAYKEWLGSKWGTSTYASSLFWPKETTINAWFEEGQAPLPREHGSFYSNLTLNDGSKVRGYGKTAIAAKSQVYHFVSHIQGQFVPSDWQQRIIVGEDYRIKRSLNLLPRKLEYYPAGQAGNVKPELARYIEPPT